MALSQPLSAEPPPDLLGHIDPSIVVFTAQEAADILRCSPDTVRRLCRAKKLHAKRLARSGEYRIFRWSLLQWMQSDDPPDADETVLDFATRAAAQRHV